MGGGGKREGEMGYVVRTSAWYSLPVAISLRQKQKVRVLATKNSEYRRMERKTEMAWLESREVVKDLVIHENSFSLYSRKWKNHLHETNRNHNG